MDHLTKQINKLRTELKLTPGEKERIRYRLLEQMITPAETLAVRSRWYWLVRVGAPALVVLFLVGGIARAAEGALPGDLFYPIKINLNETIAGTLALDTKAKAEWEIKKASRRLAEAESLALINKLDEKTQQELESKWQVASSTFAGLVKKLEHDDKEAAVKVKSSFDKEVKAREHTLKKINKSKDKKDKNNN